MEYNCKIPIASHVAVSIYHMRESTPSRAQKHSRRGQFHNPCQRKRPACKYPAPRPHDIPGAVEPISTPEVPRNNGSAVVIRFRYFSFWSIKIARHAKYIFLAYYLFRYPTHRDKYMSCFVCRLAFVEHRDRSDACYLELGAVRVPSLAYSCDIDVLSVHHFNL